MSTEDSEQNRTTSDDGVGIILSEIRLWIEFAEQCGKGDDNAIMSPPSWPTVRVLREWVKRLEAAQEGGGDDPRIGKSTQVDGWIWSNIPNKPSGKASLFTRLRRKLRKHAESKKRLLREIWELEFALNKQRAESESLKRRLKSVVRADAEWVGTRDVVRMRVDVDCHAADTTRGDLYTEAMRQLVERLRNELKIGG